MILEYKRKLCLVHLSCVGFGVKYLLSLSDEFIEKYEIVGYGASSANRLGIEFAVPEDHLQRCELYIYHNPDWIQFNEIELDAYEKCVAQVSARAKKISFPLPHFMALWPFHSHDPRNERLDRSLNRHGVQPSYPLGDSYVIGELKKGLPPKEIIANYLALDIAKEINLDQMLDWSRIWLERKEHYCDIKVSDYILGRFRSEKLFSQINHANNRLLLYATNQILHQCRCKWIPETYLDRLHELVGHEIPVHPSVRRHYGLNYIDDNTRYRIDNFTRLTFAEFIHDYVYFC